MRLIVETSACRSLWGDGDLERHDRIGAVNLLQVAKCSQQGSCMSSYAQCEASYVERKHVRHSMRKDGIDTRRGR